MRRQLKKITACVLTFAMLSTSFVFTSNANDAKSANETPVFDENNIVLSFGAMSDVHQNGAAGSVVEQKFRKAIKNLRSATNDKLDGMFFAGDLTDSGSDAQINQFKKVVMEEASEKTATVFALGNHDSSNASKAQAFYNTLGERFYSNDVDKDAIPKANRHAVINGYDFLAIEVNSYWSGSGSCSYTDANKKWLEAKLAELTSKDPNKPIFLATHPMIYDTVYGSTLGSSWYTKELTPLLEKYPQVVTFSGHLHHPLNDPRSIMQSGFTSLGCASVSYMAIEGGYVETGTGTVPGDARDFSQGLLVQIDANNNMRFRRMDFQNDREIGDPWIVPSPKQDKSHLNIYTKDRASSNKAPTFESDSLTANLSGGKNINVAFNKANDDEMVHHYDIEATKKGEKTPQVVIKRLATFYLKDEAKTYSQLINSLTSGETYDIKVFAVDSWGARSIPLSKTIEIPDGELNKDKLVSDIFNFRINDNNRLVNIADTQNFPFFNNGVLIEQENSLNSKILKFDPAKKSQVFFNLTKEKLDLITDDRGFALDIQFKLNNIPKDVTEKTTLFSSEEKGIEIYIQNGIVTCDTQISGKDISLKAVSTIQTGKYYQASFSYDGKEISVYIDGKKENAIASSGALTGMSAGNDNVYNFSIGAKQTQNKLSNILDGNIAKVRLFSYSLDEKHIAELFKMTSNNIEEAVITVPDAYVDIDFGSDGTVKDSKNNADFVQNGKPSIGETTLSHKDKEYKINAFNVKATGDNLVGTMKNIKSSAEFSQFITKGMSIEAFAVNRSPAGVQGIVCATQGGGYGIAYDGGKPYGLIETGGYVKANSDTVASSKNLTHMVLTFDFENSKMMLYVDGVLKATSAIGSQYKNTPDKLFNMFAIGADLDASGGAGDFMTSNFSIVDAKIYNSTLNKKQVEKTLGNAEKSLGIINIIPESPAPLDPIDPPVPPKPEYEIGDVNRDGFIKTVDVLMILRYKVNTISFDEEQIKLADVDQKNGVTTVDALILLKKIAGL